MPDCSHTLFRVQQSARVYLCTRVLTVYIYACYVNCRTLIRRTNTCVSRENPDTQGFAYRLLFFVFFFSFTAPSSLDVILQLFSFWVLFFFVLGTFDPDVRPCLLEALTMLTKLLLVMCIRSIGKTFCRTDIVQHPVTQWRVYY